MAYAAPSDLIIRFDVNVIRDLASDTGTAISAGAVTLDTNILAALSTASGRINAACTAGKIYTSDDLATLTGDDLAYLKDLCCSLAMAAMLRRRVSIPHTNLYETLTQSTELILEQLRKGARCFAFDANREAGLISVDGPTATEIANLNLIPSRVRHFYPSVASRLPLNRQY